MGSNAADEIDWSWSGPNPTSWQIWTSADGGNTYYLLDAVSGSTFIYFDAIGGQDTYVIGVDGGGTPVTGASNVVIVQGG